MRAVGSMPPQASEVASAVQREMEMSSLHGRWVQG